MIKIRVGHIDDLPRVFELIRELADYENGLSEVTNTVEQMRVDGFGDSPIFVFLLPSMRIILWELHFTITGIQPGRGRDFIWKILSLQSSKGGMELVSYSLKR